MHIGEIDLPPEESAALLEQFIALGYIDGPTRTGNAPRPPAGWNRIGIYPGFISKPLVMPKRLNSSNKFIPKHTTERTSFLLARCQARLGLLDEAEETVRPMLEELGDAPFALLIRGNIEFDRGHYRESLRLLLEAEKAEPRLPDLHVAIGNTHLRTLRYADAERAFEHALEIDPHSASARLGLAFALLRQRRFDEAAGAAILAVGLQHHLPMADFHLGCGLVRLQMFDRAIKAFEMALKQRAARRSWRIAGYLVFTRTNRMARNAVPITSAKR